ncbi:RNA polymerase sigma factor [Candidatus Darwinibacter acetoxidans]
MEPVEALKRGDEAISWLVDAISHISSFRGDASVYTWLYAILLRRCRRMQVREAISALDNEEFSIKEMAQLLGVPEGPFKNWLHRAREKLRVPLESEEEICLYRRTSMPCGCWPASTKLALTAWRKKIGTTGTSLTTTWKRAWLS